jgi:hypothetical protein
MCMGIPEGRVGYMGGSHMGKVSKGWSLIDILVVPIKISGIAVPIKIFSYFGSN